MVKTYRPPAQSSRPAETPARPQTVQPSPRPAAPIRTQQTANPQSADTRQRAQPQRQRTPAELFPDAPVIAPNTWLSGNLPADSLKEPASRGENDDYIYTMFVRILGVEDKSYYERDLFLWRKNWRIREGM